MYEDARAMVFARNALPSLLNEIDAQAARIAELERERDALRADLNEYADPQRRWAGEKDA